jgi:molybdopterin synthase sulfur carrier subunit
MAQVVFTPNLQRHVNCPPAAADAASVREALDIVFAANPQLRSYVVDDQGRLRKHVNVYVNDRMVKDRIALSDAVSANDEIFVFQALSGG